MFARPEGRGYLCAHCLNYLECVKRRKTSSKKIECSNFCDFLGGSPVLDNEAMNPDLISP